jgi:flagellar biosynthesis chaperone FliJ
MTNHHDRGLRAVARVREVRERDSRLGLLHALGRVRDHEARVDSLGRALDEAAARSYATLTEFTDSRRMLRAMAETLTAAEHDLESSRVVALQAHTRWQSDKAACNAIEHLLDERARMRAEEAVRAENREIDDIVSRLHLRQSIRRRSHGHHSGHQGAA